MCNICLWNQGEPAHISSNHARGAYRNVQRSTPQATTQTAITFSNRRNRDRVVSVITLAEAKCILATAVCVSFCVSVCLSIAAFPNNCTDPDISSGNGTGVPSVVHYWADLKSMHGFRCCDNTHVCKLYTLQMRIAPNAKCERLRVLVLALYGLIQEHCNETGIKQTDVRHVSKVTVDARRRK